MDVEIFTLDYFWSPDGGLDANAAARRRAFRLPEGIDWDILTIADVADRGSHAWVEYEGLCFDAETAEGVDSPFDLPSVRHALTEIVDADPILFPDDLESRGWWVRSRTLRADRESEMEMPACAAGF